MGEERADEDVQEGPRKPSGTTIEGRGLSRMPWRETNAPGRVRGSQTWKRPPLRV